MRETLIPPPVLPAQAPQNISSNYKLTVLGPLGIVHRAKAGGADNARHVKQGVAHTLEKAAVHIGNAGRNGDYGGADDDKVPAQFLVFQYGLEVSHKHKEIDVEVYSKKKHED